MVLNMPELMALAKVKLDQAQSEQFKAMSLAHLAEAKRLIELAMGNEQRIIR